MRFDIEGTVLGKKSVNASADSESALFRPRPDTEAELGLFYDQAAGSGSVLLLDLSSVYIGTQVSFI